ncbi:S-layer homology domain-containing protein [Candidatus Peregrinibacteria bacterium]|nr:S-layer homology domain-containing protein [Candidatus Peregrinibacteria bacterium]
MNQVRLKILSRRAFPIFLGITLLGAIFLNFLPCGDVQAALVHASEIAPFSDVSIKRADFTAIQYVQSNHIVEGYSDGTYRPDNPINRAEFTKIVIQSYFQDQARGSECFPDVSMEWYAKYVCFGKDRAFIAGYPDGKFYPANDINFVEVSKILVNASGTPVTPDPLVWYKPFVDQLALANAIPVSITSFTKKVTRGEMAEMIYRLRADIRDKASKTHAQLVIENSSPQEQAALGLPVRLKIPVIHVDSAIEYVGLTPEGAVGIPIDPDNAAWYDLSPRPGDLGSAVITGHVNWFYGAKGVFENLSKVKPGDRILVQDIQGNAISFAIREIRNFDAAAVATDVFSSNDGKAHLNLITCEGVWDKRAQQYTQRLVVFAEKVDE